MKKKYVILSVTVVAVVLLDIITKAYIDSHMSLHESVVVVGGFLNITYVRNPGAAFSFLASASPGFRSVFFLTVTILAIILVLYYIAKSKTEEPFMIFALSLILTDGPKMTVTPTYWVFEMYRVHQGATSLPVALITPDYKLGDQAIPAVSASASRDAAGKVHLSLVNTDPQQPVTVTCTLEGVAAKTVTGRILTAAAMNARNTFEAPNAVHPVPFTGASLAGATLTVALPAKSVVVLEL